MSEIRFPSGITITQARKNAKKLAKSESIKLHEAQNRTARANGLNLPWDKSIEWLHDQVPPGDSEHQNMRQVLSNDDCLEVLQKYDLCANIHSPALAIITDCNGDFISIVGRAIESFVLEAVALQAAPDLPHKPDPEKQRAKLAAMFANADITKAD